MEEYKDPGHDYRHIMRVVENFWNIVERDETTELIHIGFLAATLHDMFDSKFLTTKEALDKKKQEIRDLLGDRPLLEDIIEVAENISWSRYRKNGVPRFDRDVKVRAWKLVSMADWMDAQLVVRAKDYILSRDPSTPLEQVKKSVKEHWDEKLVHLHEHAFDPVVREMMMKRMEEQKVVLEKWLAE